MSNKQMWQKVFLAAVVAGQPEWMAKQCADSAIKNAPKA